VIVFPMTRNLISKWAIFERPVCQKTVPVSAIVTAKQFLPAVL